jgi:hypothetical protein
MTGKITITTGLYNAATGQYEHHREPAAAPSSEIDAFIPDYQAREPEVDPNVFKEVAQEGEASASCPPNPRTEPTEHRTPIDLKYVQDKARRLVAIEDRLEEIAAEEKQLKEEQRQIRIFQLPEAMYELDIRPPVIGVGNRVVEVESLVTATLPSKDKEPEKRERAINAIIDMKLGGNVKRSLEIDFPSGDAIIEHKVVDAINALDPALKPRINTTIHHSTYTAMISKLIAKGTPIDRDLLGVWVGNIAKVRKVKDNL